MVRRENGGASLHHRPRTIAADDVGGPGPEREAAFVTFREAAGCSWHPRTRGLGTGGAQRAGARNWIPFDLTTARQRDSLSCSCSPLARAFATIIIIRTMGAGLAEFAR